MTIHQPSAKIFSLLSKVIFLSKGKTTYNGPADELLKFTARVYNEFNLGALNQGNAPELFLDLCDQLQSRNDIDSLISKFENEKKAVTSIPSSLSLPGDNTPAEVSYANSVIGDVAILCETDHEYYPHQRAFRGKIWVNNVLRIIRWYSVLIP